MFKAEFGSVTESNRTELLSLLPHRSEGVIFIPPRNSLISSVLILFNSGDGEALETIGEWRGVYEGFQNGRMRHFVCARSQAWQPCLLPAVSCIVCVQGSLHGARIRHKSELKVIILHFQCNSKCSVIVYMCHCHYIQIRCLLLKFPTTRIIRHCHLHSCEEPYYHLGDSLSN